MKNARLFSVLMAAVMFITAIAPAPVAAMGITGQATGASFGSIPSMSNLSYIPDYVSNNATNSGTYSCYLVKQSPADWTTMKPRQYFDMMWTVVNTGHKWDANYTEVKYIYGPKMQTRGDFFYLDGNIGYGRKLHIGIDMVAPKAPGTYSITWGVYSGSYSVCYLTFILTVVK